MSERASWRATLALGRHCPGLVLAVLAFGLSCQDNNHPCYGLKVGDHVAITIVDMYQRTVPFDAGSPEACGFGFDLEQGMVLEAAVARAVPPDPDVCTPFVPEFSPFAGWTWTLLPGDSHGSSEIFGGEYTATNGSCTGHVELSVYVTGDPYAHPDAEPAPNVTMDRRFGGTGAPGCPSTCAGSFVVNLQKL